MNTELIDRLVTRWNAPGGRPLSGSLIADSTTAADRPDCMCAQGWALYESGMTLDDIANLAQVNADTEVAKRLGISRTHAVLLRCINDSRPDSPSVVLTDPAAVLGNQADRVLAFWRHLDTMTKDDWRKVAAAWDAAWDAAGAAAGDAAGDAAWDAAWAAAWAAAGDVAWAAAWASNEIQGAAIMRERGQPFFFLPMFGFATPEDIPA